MKFYIGLGGSVTIKRVPTPVEDEEAQSEIEQSHSFKKGFVHICKAPKEKPAGPEPEQEEEEFEDTEDGRLSYGLDELKEMPVAQLRTVAKRASLWKKGMTKEDMIAALTGG